MTQEAQIAQEIGPQPDPSAWRRSVPAWPIPKLAIVGHGRCGKDTMADWLKEHTFLRYEGGCSWVARFYMARRLEVELGRKVTPEEAFSNRHQDRMKWYDYLNEWREGDPARLVRMVLEESDFVTGIRAGDEFRAARTEGLIDLAIWIERPGVPIDPTLTYERGECDVVIYNDADLQTYYGRIERLARAIGVMR